MAEEVTQLTQATIMSIWQGTIFPKRGMLEPSSWAEG